MRPAFSVILLTTLIGAGQGLVIAVAAAEWGLLAVPAPRAFLAAGSALAAGLAALGLLASFFHLGRPERAWRSATRWRTSWLSREVVALPLFIAAAAAHAVGEYTGVRASIGVGLGALVASLVLFLCTAMIYASIRFLQEWASPLTVVNFAVLGTASGFTLATATAAWLAPAVVAPLAGAAAALTLAGLATRLAALARNARLAPRSTLATAIGMAGGPIAQRSRGFTAAAFNTREFFHGATEARMAAVRNAFLALAFVVPALLLGIGVSTASPGILASAFAVQYLGLVAERWYFFAEARHPQNLYYQSVA